MWKDVKNYEGLYQVSDDGKVKSLARQVQGPYNSIHKLKEKELKPWIGAGYFKVTLRKDGIETVASVHRLVAQAFIPNPNSYDVVNHKDGNKMNNNASNLEWCTASDNMYHAFNTGLNKPHSKLSYDDVVNIATRKFTGQRAGYVYQDYAHKISKPGFYSVWGGYSHTKIYENIKENFKNE